MINYKELETIGKLVPLTNEQVIDAKAIGNAIINLKDTDLQKTQKQLWDMWQKGPATPENIAIFKARILK